MRVTVIGTGYVGTVTGACLAFLGHRVTCVDVDANKIEMLRRGDMPIYEPHLDTLLQLACEKGGVDFSTDLRPAVAASDIVFIAVGTPPLASGEADLSYLESAAHSIGAAMDSTKYRVVVNKSTVPVGSGNLVETLVKEGIQQSHPNGHGIRFGVASNPEFLREGSAIADSFYADRIVLGSSDAPALEMLTNLYRPVAEQSFEPPAFLPRPTGFDHVPVVVTSLTSAEMIKYAANNFLALKIGFANEIANVCERVGADVTEVTAGIGLDKRIGGRFLNAGLGWGGSCFGKDIQALLHIAGEYGYHARILEASLEVNRAQRQLAIQKLQEKLFILKGRTVALLGLAFKADTDDLRDAPSLQIAERLLHMGARVKAYDPVAMQACRQQHPTLKIQYADSALEAASEADAAVLVTEWAEFAALDLEKLAAAMNRRVLIDGRNFFNPDAALRAGFDYCGIGRTIANRRPVTADAVA